MVPLPSVVYSSWLSLNQQRKDQQLDDQQNITKAMNNNLMITYMTINNRMVNHTIRFIDDKIIGDGWGEPCGTSCIPSMDNAKQSSGRYLLASPFGSGRSTGQIKLFWCKFGPSPSLARSGSCSFRVGLCMDLLISDVLDFDVNSWATKDCMQAKRIPCCIVGGSLTCWGGYRQPFPMIMFRIEMLRVTWGWIMVHQLWTLPGSKDYCSSHFCGSESWRHWFNMPVIQQNLGRQDFTIFTMVNGPSIHVTHDFILYIM